MPNRVLSLHTLSATESTLFTPVHTRTAVCRAATLACALSEAPGALPPPDATMGAWTTVAFDPTTMLLYEHVRRTRQYRNLTVLMAQVTFGEELADLTRKLLTLTEQDMFVLICDTVKALGFEPPDTRLRARTRAAGTKHLRALELSVLRLLITGDADLMPETKAALEAERLSIQRKIAALSATES